MSGRSGTDAPVSMITTTGKLKLTHTGMIWRMDYSAMRGEENAIRSWDDKLCILEGDAFRHVVFHKKDTPDEVEPNAIVYLSGS